MTESCYWSCAQTYPQQEKIALANLRSQDFQAFFPFIITHDRHRNIRIQNLFPGYIFIQLNLEQEWWKINYTHGINRVIMLAGTEIPCKVPDNFIKSIKRPIIPKKPTQDEPNIPKRGDVIKIPSGAFADHQALVEWTSQRRISLLLSLLGRKVQVNMALTDILYPT